MFNGFAHYSKNFISTLNSLRVISHETKDSNKQTITKTNETAMVTLVRVLWKDICLFSLLPLTAAAGARDAMETGSTPLPRASPGAPSSCSMGHSIHPRILTWTHFQLLACYEMQHVSYTLRVTMKKRINRFCYSFKISLLLTTTHYGI